MGRTTKKALEGSDAHGITELEGNAIAWVVLDVSFPFAGQGVHYCSLWESLPFHLISWQ